MGGGAKPFGVDQQRVPALARRLIQAGAEWRGLHICTGSQALDSGAIAETQANVLDLAARLAGEIGAPLPHLNMGGGLGIPYSTVTSLSLPRDGAPAYRSTSSPALAAPSSPSR